ncbi:MAG: diacylglycerol kinase [Candidatus Spechtbacterales bacterium]|nr:diacylglycerol kinase [Candidatus Spechtbacterales bacterium]
MKSDPRYYREYSKTPLTERILHASRGIYNAWRKEPNFRIEALIALLVLGAMLILPLTSTERAVLVVVITIVLALETINSIIERVLNIIHPEFSDEVKKIKDTMAGVVFMASAASVVVGLFILTRPMLQLDIYIQNLLQLVRSQTWVAAASFFTLLGDWKIIVGLAVILVSYLISKKRYGDTTFLIGSVLMGYVFLYLLKWGFGRERPISVDFFGAHEYAFPSGHVFIATVFFFAAAFVLSRYKKNKYLFLIAGAVVAAVALTRVVLSVHWFSDVVGGFIFAIFWLLLSYGINNDLWRRGES